MITTHAFIDHNFKHSLYFFFRITFFLSTCVPRKKKRSLAPASSRNENRIMNRGTAAYSSNSNKHFFFFFKEKVKKRNVLTADIADTRCGQ